jgi:hypothetical protein
MIGWEECGLGWHGLKYVPQKWPGLAKFQPATEIDQLQLTFLY